MPLRPSQVYNLQVDMHRYVNQSGTPEEKARQHISPQIRLWPDSLTSKWYAAIYGHGVAMVSRTGKTPELAIAALAEMLHEILPAAPEVVR